VSARALHRLVLTLLYCFALASLQFFLWRALGLLWVYSIPINLVIGFGIGYVIRKWV
jgi:hypothetical protein